MAMPRTGDVIANHPLYASIREQLPGIPDDKTAEITMSASSRSVRFLASVRWWA